MATITPAPYVPQPLHARQQPGGGQPQQGGGGGQPQQGGGQPPQGGGGGQQQPRPGQSASSSAITIPSTAAAGGLLFTQPPQTAAASFYKIAPSQPVTFGWNFTSLVITPSALTVRAFCSDNGNTYPVGPTDGVIPGSATQVVWDVYSYDQAHPSQPLAIASYTLQIMDNHGLTQVPLPGRFQPNQQLTFGLYRPQTYVPLASFTCNGCSSATHFAPIHPILLSFLATFTVMILGGLSVLRRR